MDYFFYNTDVRALPQSKHRKLISKGYAVAGGDIKHGKALGRFQKNDVVLMYEAKVGVIAVGTALEKWDEVAHKKPWYYESAPEYRVRVDWFLDLTDRPVSIDELATEIFKPRGTTKRIVEKHDAAAAAVAKWMHRGRVVGLRRRRPKIVDCHIQRIVRDTAIANTVKAEHGHKCQICGLVLQLIGRPYSEAHHIHPLGKNGYDDRDNIICVCPNCHVLLDRASIRLDVKKLNACSSLHQVNPEFIDYHNRMVDKKEAES